MAALHELGLAEAGREIAAGRLAAFDLAQALLARAEAHRQLNAFVTVNGERILAAARAADAHQASGKPLGALHGAPIAFKDNIETRDDPTTAGSRALSGYVASQDAPIVERLVSAGAIPFGKTGMHEFAFGITSNNAAFGPVRNPFDTSRSPGGSSGGSGAAVGARLAPAAIGTDTGGSIRIPAGFCGLWGYRPTLGRWPTGGIVPIARSRDTPGPLARHMEDIALLDEAATGEAPHAFASLRGQRIGVPASHFQDLDDEVEALARAALRRLAAAGAELVEIDLPDVWDLTRATQPIVFFEARQELSAWFAARDGRSLREVAAEIASPDVARVFKALAAEPPVIPPGVYRATRDRALPALRDVIFATMRRERLAALAYPVTPARAPRLGDDEGFSFNGRMASVFETIIRHADVTAAAGGPSLAVPIGLDSGGVPIGLELAGMPGEDRALLGLGFAVEREGFAAAG